MTYKVQIRAQTELHAQIIRRLPIMFLLNPYIFCPLTVWTSKLGAAILCDGEEVAHSKRHHLLFERIIELDSHFTTCDEQPA